MKTLSRPRCARALVEMLESRQLASVTSYSQSSIEDFSEAPNFAQFEIGDVGSYSPGILIGSGSDLGDSQLIGWDDDYSNGVDSTSTAFTYSLDLSSSGGQSLSLSGNTLNSDAGGISAITSVTIRACVLGADMAFTLSNLQVKFYSGSTLTETISPSNETANTFDATSNDPAEAVTVITPTSNTNTKVVVTGFVRLQAQAGTYPSNNDIFGDIRVS